MTGAVHWFALNVAPWFTILVAVAVWLKVERLKGQASVPEGQHELDDANLQYQRGIVEGLAAAQYAIEVERRRRGEFLEDQRRLTKR